MNDKTIKAISEEMENSDLAYPLMKESYVKYKELYLTLIPIMLETRFTQLEARYLSWCLSCWIIRPYIEAYDILLRDKGRVN